MRALMLLPFVTMLAATPANACRFPVRPYLGWIERADAIVIGEVEGTSVGSTTPEQLPASRVRVRPTALLKGETLPEAVSLPGIMTNSSETALLDRLPEMPRYALTLCRTFVFDPGEKVLLLLERDAAGLHVIDDPLAGQVVGHGNTLWESTIRLYAEVAALPRNKRRAALIDHRARFRAAKNDPDAQHLADTIDRELWFLDHPEKARFED